MLSIEISNVFPGLTDAFEDIKRHISDRTENLKKVKVGIKKLTKETVEQIFKVVRWNQIKVG